MWHELAGKGTLGSTFLEGFLKDAGGTLLGEPWKNFVKDFLRDAGGTGCRMPGEPPGARQGHRTQASKNTFGKPIRELIIELNN